MISFLRTVFNLPIFLSLFLFGLTPEGVQADYRASFQQGIEAFDGKRWQDVALHMRSAIAEQSQAGERIKIYGMRFELYIPHYYLGVALYELGDCSGAVAAWKRSRDQGVVKASQLRRIQSSQDACHKRLNASPPPSPPKPPPPVKREIETSRSLERDAIEQVMDQSLSILNRTRAAKERLQLALGKHSTALPKELRSQATAILTSIDTVGTDLERVRRAGDLEQVEAFVLQFDVVRREAEEITEGIEIFVRKSETKSSKMPQKTTEPPSTRNPQARIDDPSAKPTSPTPTPSKPTQLREASKAFFGARYQEVLEKLKNTDGLKKRPRALAHLLRAAAYHALYIESIEPDLTLLQAAVDEVTACRRLDLSILPLERYFSPIFVSFFSKK